MHACRSPCLRVNFACGSHMSCDSLAHNTIQLGYLRLLYNEDDAARLQTKTFVLFLEHAVAPVCTHGACCRRSSAHIHGHIHLWACTRAYTFVRYVYMCTSTDGLHSTNGHAFLRMVGQTHGIHTRSLKQISLDRILNIPPRGVGAQTRRALLSFAQAPAQCFLHVCVCSVDR